MMGVMNELSSRRSSSSISWILLAVSVVFAVAMPVVASGGNCETTLWLVLIAVSMGAAIAAAVTTFVRQRRSAPGDRHVAQSVVIYIAFGVLMFWTWISLIIFSFASDGC